MQLPHTDNRHLVFRLFATLIALFVLQNPAFADELTAQCRKGSGDEAYTACKTLYEDFNARDKWLILQYGKLLENRGRSKIALKVYSDGKQRYRSSVIDTRLKILTTLEQESKAVHITATPTTSSKLRKNPEDVKHRMACRVYELSDPANVPVFCKDDSDDTGKIEILADPSNTPDAAGQKDNSGIEDIEFADSRHQDSAQNAALDATTDSTNTAKSITSISSDSVTSNREVITNETYSDIQSQLDELKAMLQQRMENPSTTQLSDPVTIASSTPDSRPRHALVIGNANYETEGKALISSINDANDVANTLTSLGFSVILKTDVASLFEFESALLSYQRKLSDNPNAIGVVFYAGHAIQFDGMNYLIPTGAEIRGPQDVRAKSISLSYIQDTLEYAGNELNLVVLDSCRDNPFRSLTRSENSGLTLTYPTTDGFLVIYAAKPGSRALDSAGRNSPFTKHFVNTIVNSEQPIEMMFKDLARAVVDETQGEQTPWIEGQYLGKFVFSTPSQ